jgi:signal transduction histidine kinase
LLRSILSNLITNAIKFSPGKEKVIVSIAEVGDHVEISVKDEGIGIPKDELDNIFEPFLRGKNAESIPGTGLGLSITKNAVELLKGKLHAESQLDSGTVFKVLIPRSL